MTQHILGVLVLLVFLPFLPFFLLLPFVLPFILLAVINTAIHPALTCAKLEAECFMFITSYKSPNSPSELGTCI